MRKTNKSLKILINVLLMIGIGFVCFPIVKNTVTLFKVQHTKIRQVQRMTDQKPNHQKNEKIELPTIESYWSASSADISEAVGQLSIPSVGINVPIFYGLHNEELLFGAGMMYPERKFDRENVVILGHHLGMKELLLGNLDNVSSGDNIYIRFLDQRYSYQVTKKKIVKETDLSVLENTSEPQVTLITCDSPYLTDQRVVVTANRTLEEPSVIKKRMAQAEFKEEKKVTRKSIVKYSGLPIILIIIVLVVCTFCIWRYL